MNRIYITASDNIINDLKIISNQMERTLSKATCEIIELGLISYKNQQKIELINIKKMVESNLKNKDYLLRILNINAEILRKLYNEPSKYNAKNVDSILSEIQIQTKKHIETDLINRNKNFLARN